MGQKVNPHGLRVGVIKDWDSRWFANDSEFGDILVEDYNLRKTLKKQLYAAGVPKIEIERRSPYRGGRPAPQNRILLLRRQKREHVLAL